jgi:hypothetical protein
MGDAEQGPAPANSPLRDEVEMRILLIAYEFPPSPSPQSLRWAYLGRALVRAGHEVHVLTTEPVWTVAGLPDLPEQMRVHRVSGGPIANVMAMLARRQEARMRVGEVEVPVVPDTAAVSPAAEAAAPSALPMVALRESRLNWKGRLVEQFKRVAMAFLFPDTRGEWYFPARKVIDRLVREIRPDVVVSSHEPATTLELGIYLKRRHGIPWLADLGDPVLADYTPKRWRRRAFRVERRVMALADGITVTAPGTRRLLIERHGLPAAGEEGIAVLPQGFDDQGGSSVIQSSGFFDGERLELLYTGSFYQFRRPDALIAAVMAVPGVRLSVASSVIPDWLRPRFESQPEKFRLLGFMPHAGVLALQRNADVLVNIANDNPCQVPGKVYEYLGARRPILHTGNVVDGDVSATLIRERRRGWICADQGATETLLRTLVARKRTGQLDAEDLDLGEQAVAEFGWSRLAQRLAAMLARLAESGRVSSGIPAGQRY